MEQRVSRITQEMVGKEVKLAGWDKWLTVICVHGEQCWLGDAEGYGTHSCKSMWDIRDPQTEKLPSERLESVLNGKVSRSDAWDVWDVVMWADRSFRVIGQILDEMWKERK